MPLIITKRTYEDIVEEIKEIYYPRETEFDVGCYLFSITDKKLFVFFGKVDNEYYKTKVQEVELENSQMVYEKLEAYSKTQGCSFAEMGNSDCTIKINVDALSTIIDIDSKTQKPYIAPTCLDTKVYVIWGGDFPKVYYFDSGSYNLGLNIQKLSSESGESGKVIWSEENYLTFKQMINGFIKQSRNLFKMFNPESTTPFLPFIAPEQAGSWYKKSSNMKEILPLMRHTIWSFFCDSLKEAYGKNIKNNNTSSFFSPAYFEQLEKTIKTIFNRMVDISPDNTLSEMFSYCFQEISDFDQLNNFFKGAIEKLERCCRSFDQLFVEENVENTGMSPAGIKYVFENINKTDLKWIIDKILDCKDKPDHDLFIQRYPDCVRQDFIIFKK